jgi:hypothetical protein
MLRVQPGGNKGSERLRKKQGEGTTDGTREVSSLALESNPRTCLLKQEGKRTTKRID